MTETSAILRLAEQADETIEQCEFCGLRGHRVKDCPAYVEYLKGFEKPARYAEYYPKPAVSKTLLRWLAGGCFGLCVAVIYWWISWR